MRAIRPVLGVLVAAACLGGGWRLPAQEAEPTLKVGDAAPALQAGTWVQGEPVQRLETGTVYVVEFWATWCGPCRQSIPHLDRLHRQFKDRGVVVIGQNCWEQDPAAVTNFVQSMGTSMTYRVALDTADGRMSASWVNAAGESGIPVAFVVDRVGRIAWIGHPMSGLDKVLAGVLDGSFSPRQAAEQKGRLEAINERLHDALEALNWDEALAVVAELEKAVPAEEAGLAPKLMRFRILVQKGDDAAAHAAARELAAAGKSDPHLLHELAWVLVTDKRLKQPDLDFARQCATQANDLTGGSVSAVLDTLASICFAQGEKQKAVELQQQAVEKAGEPEKEYLQERLESYKKGRAPAAE